MATSSEEEATSAVALRALRSSADISEKPASNGRSPDLLSEACTNPEFERFVHGGDDPTALRWASLCLGLIEARDMQAEERLPLYEAIMLVSRTKTLSHLVGRPVSRSLLALLTRPGSAVLDQGSIGRLAAIEDPKTRRALSQLDRVTASLAHQIGDVPVELRSVRLLRLLNDLELTEAFWTGLHSALKGFSSALRSNFEARLRRTGTRADFFTVVAEIFEREVWETAYALPITGFHDQRLKLLGRPADMAAEASRMKNCLREHWSLPLAGNIAYGAWYGEEAATVEMVFTGDSWTVRSVRGTANASVSGATEAEIKTVVSAVETLEGTGFKKADRTGAYIAAQAERARAEFPRHSFEALHEALQKLLESPIPNNDHERPFRVFSVEANDQPFIQFLVDQWEQRRVLLCEIASHKFQPHLEKHLNEQSFRFLRDSGFQWPRDQANFKRWFLPENSLSPEQLAYFSLASLRKIFHVNCDDPISVS